VVSEANRIACEKNANGAVPVVHRILLAEGLLHNRRLFSRIALDVGMTE
jgi:hypothetical protein